MRYQQFLKSALTKESLKTTCESVIDWIEKRNNDVSVNVSKIRFSELDQWNFDDTNGSLKHKSGKFFSIEGIDVQTNWGSVASWQQPIVNQPEIGFLGIVAKEIDGILHFLMQAKIEPGNVNNVQISPTLQATKSNYTQVHKGHKPLYLEYFLERRKHRVLLDQLQSEQGARFLRKRNRNMIIQVEEDLPVYDNFLWLTLGQLKELIGQSNLVNMDTRTVVSGIPYGSYPTSVVNFYNNIEISGRQDYEQGMLISSLDGERSLYAIDDIITWFTQLKTMYEMVVKPVSLFDLKDWVIEEDQIRHKENRFFKVIAAYVEISNREVTTWSQPLIEPAQNGLCAFIVKRINGVYHFLVQAKLECGNFDILEMAPTVQCLTGNYRETKKGILPFLDYVLNVKPEQIKYDTFQSEEGGRFYREENRNMIIEADDDFPMEVPENYTWMTLNQMSFFLKFNNYLNIQARSLISAVRFV
jgi:oxidase EvaA